MLTFTCENRHSPDFGVSPQMKLPEDRHPLLYVYLDNEEPGRIRSRYVSQGATNLLGRWPEHLTFSWMMGVIGLMSLLTCFLLAVILLIVSSSSHHHGRNLIDKCERNEHVIQLVHMKNLEDLTVNENATYFVEIFTNESQYMETVCSIESFLKQTTETVFLVSISSKELSENVICDQLEKQYGNFKTITFDLNSFFNRTVFANFQSQDPKFLVFLAKILVSWNVGGTVMDPKVLTLKFFQGIMVADEKSLTVGTFENDVIFISTKRFCHVFIFDVLKTILETKNILKYSELDVIKTAKQRFCHGKWSCRGFRIISHPEICGGTKIEDNCTFFIPKLNALTSMFSNLTSENFCPLVKTLI